ncbi:hypothetical protein [Haladaptatus salinisoli]|uniref:hypothetical protein n=1 Tax=Haladaptatus salinisoli TaxID=2884876 RepID=UPI001D0ABD75|nr:hypothetical protein [Haladaptatus salinisoli]
MDLSEAAKDDSSGTTRVDVKTTVEIDDKNFAIIADEVILMPKDTPNAESKLAEACDVEITTVDEIWKEAGGLACLAGGAT